jgi:hypothetical protein
VKRESERVHLEHNYGASPFVPELHQMPYLLKPSQPLLAGGTFISILKMGNRLPKLLSLGI